MREDDNDKKLFSRFEKVNIDSAAPLAVRMRPRKLDEFIGQRHILGSDKLLTRMLAQVPQLGVKIVEHGPKTQKVFTTSRSFSPQQ